MSNQNPNEDINNKKLRLLVGAHLVAGALHAGSTFALVGLTAGDDVWEPSLELPRNYWRNTTDANCSNGVGDSCFYQVQEHDTYGISLVGLCYFFAAWSALLHTVIGVGGVLWFNGYEDYNPFKSYKNSIDNRFGAWRWADYILSASVMVVVITIYCGVVDTWTLLGVGLAEAAVVFLGAVSEYALGKSVESKIDSNEKKALLAVSKWLLGGAFALFFVLWVPGIATFFYSIDGGEDRAQAAVPDIVYVIIFAYPVTFLQFGLVSWRVYRNRARNYKFYEMLFILLSLVSKVLLHWSIYFGLLARTVTLSNAEFERSATGNIDENALIAIVGSVLGAGLLAATGVWLYWKRTFKFQDNFNTAKRVTYPPRAARAYYF